MCGFAFIASCTPQSLDTLRIMGDKIAHRGPDDHGHALWSPDNGFMHVDDEAASPQQGHVLFHHRRLSILDMSSHGHQPMRYKGLTLLFNGEIYNYKELKTTIPLPFDSESDTEVLLKGLYVFGPSFIARLRGMFAFVTFDENTQNIIMARDHFGIKPLYYTHDEQGLYMASEIKALLPLLKKRVVDQKRAHDFLYRGLTEHHHNTCFHGIHQYPSSSFSVISLKNCPNPLTFEKYWQAPLGPSSQKSTLKDAKEQITEHLKHALTLHTRSDVPLLGFLSGGLDSSLLMCLASHLNLPIKDTLSYIASDPKISEEPYVDAVTHHLGMKNHKVFLDNASFEKDMDRLIFHQDQPFASTSIYAQFKLFEAVQKKGFKVTVDGQGADEIFAGYGMYGHFQKAKNIKGRPFHLLSLPFSTPLKDNFRTLSYVMGKGVAYNPFVLKKTFSCFDQSYPNLHHFLKDTLERSNLPALLRYMDRNSMAFSIESRVPFLWPELVEAAYALSSTLLIKEEQKKYILYEMGKPYLPKKIYKRRTKLSFNTPESFMLSQSKEWVHEVLRHASSTIVNVEKMKRAYALNTCSNAFWKSLCYVRWKTLFHVEEA